MVSEYLRIAVSTSRVQTGNEARPEMPPATLSGDGMRAHFIFSALEQRWAVLQEALVTLSIFDIHALKVMLSLAINMPLHSSNRQLWGTFDISDTGLDMSLQG